MRFVIDDKIPYIKGVLEPFGEVKYKPGAEICREDLLNADGLIIRTRTKCNKELLEGTAVKFIATATIGFDHIDTEYCDKHGITWTSAPGCNSGSVNQYLASALCYWSEQKNISLKNLTLGIVGVGNVGSKVARNAEILGMNVLKNDPPRERSEGSDEFVDLQTILDQADIISLHVPLNKTGRDKTYHLVDEKFLAKWKNPGLLINTCRGEVSKTQALLEKLENNALFDCIIDCWENEPDIDINLLERCFIGTPHIAGYSRDGKANGTSQSIQALSRHFNLGIDNFYPDVIEAPYFPNIIIDGSGKSEEEIISSAIQSTYEINHDNRALRENPGDFEKLRGDYPVRREFQAYKITASNLHQDIIIRLESIGFAIT